MQLKLLNFHKMLANLSSNLVGAFIPLIIYSATQNIVLAILYLVAVNLLRFLFTMCFRKLYTKYPQLFLVLRIIPIVLYNAFILLLDYNIWAGVIGVCIFVALNNSINSCTREIIYNYSSLNKDSKSLGITRVFEQCGTIVALVVGGFLLDTNKLVVIAISLGIYMVSVVPLLIYYIRGRKQENFNVDATSNALLTIQKDTEKHGRQKQIVKKFLFGYGVVYFLFAFIDLMSTTFNLYIFINGGLFSACGIFSAVYNGSYAIGSYIFSKLNEQKDLTKLVSIICIALGVFTVILPFINNVWILYIIFGIIGFVHPALSLFVLSRLFIKSRILGVSNVALFVRENSCVGAYGLGYAFGLFGTLVPIFGIILVCMTAAGFFIPKNEEKSRKLLVDFLQENEIRHR